MHEDSREQREAAWKMRIDDGHGGKASYQQMINENWLDDTKAHPHETISNMRICICVRKRPIF